MNKLADLPRQTITTEKGLWERIVYQDDQEDEGHVHKILHTPGNYNCVGQSAAEFAADVLENARRYRESRKGKLGKCTDILFHELIFSTIEGAYLKRAQKRLIELAWVAILEGVPVRLVWHDDPETGRSDLHILFGYHTPGDTPKPLLSTHYGAGKASFGYMRMVTEKEFTDKINGARGDDEPKLRMTADIARERRSQEKQEKQTPADTLIALFGDVWDGNQEKLAAALKEKKLTVKRENDDFLSVILPGRKRAVRLYRDELADAYRRAKQRELAAAKKAATKERQLGSGPEPDL